MIITGVAHWWFHQCFEFLLLKHPTAIMEMVVEKYCSSRITAHFAVLHGKVLFMKRFKFCDVMPFMM